MEGVSVVPAEEIEGVERGRTWAEEGLVSPRSLVGKLRSDSKERRSRDKIKKKKKKEEREPERQIAMKSHPKLLYQKNEKKDKKDQLKLIKFKSECAPRDVPSLRLKKSLPTRIPNDDAQSSGGEAESPLAKHTHSSSLIGSGKSTPPPLKANWLNSTIMKMKQQQSPTSDSTPVQNSHSSDTIRNLSVIFPQRRSPTPPPNHHYAQPISSMVDAYEMEDIHSSTSSQSFNSANCEVESSLFNSSSKEHLPENETSYIPLFTSPPTSPLEYRRQDVISPIPISSLADQWKKKKKPRPILKGSHAKRSSHERGWTKKEQSVVRINELVEVVRGFCQSTVLLRLLVKLNSLENDFVIKLFQLSEMFGFQLNVASGYFYFIFHHTSFQLLFFLFFLFSSPSLLTSFLISNIF
jgi:hypothetical protein